MPYLAGKASQGVTWRSHLGPLLPAPVSPGCFLVVLVKQVAQAVLEVQVVALNRERNKINNY
jgi:hypothetical protein